MELLKIQALFVILITCFTLSTGSPTSLRFLQHQALTIFLNTFSDDFINSINSFNHMNWNSNSSCLDLQLSLEIALSNPPCCISREFITFFYIQTYQQLS